MPVITTRPKEVDLNIVRLQNLVEFSSAGAIAFGTGEYEPADNVPDLLEQLEIASTVAIDLIDKNKSQIEQLSFERLILKQHLSNVVSEHRRLKDVEYDDALDHATIDAMEALAASGASDTTADGELSFLPAIVMTKEDFKPIVRQALRSWLALKIG